MRRFAPLGLLAACAFFMVSPLQAQDVTGDWTLTYTMAGRQGQSMERTMEFTFQQDGTTLTGTTVMQMRGRPGGGEAPAAQEVAIQDGKVEGNQITFSIVRGMGERSMTLTFTGTVSGTTMEGNLTMSGGMGGGEPVPFKGVKK